MRLTGYTSAVKWRIPLGIFLGLSLVSAGCGGRGLGAQSVEGPAGKTWAEIEEAAQQEGELVFYTSTHDSINRPEFEAFNKEYPDIDIKPVRLATDELTARFSSETKAGAPSADLLKPADSLLMQENPDWFLDLDESLVPNLGKLPESAVHSDYFEIVVGPYVFTYNTDLIDTAPSDYCQLTAPKYAGKVLLNSPSPGTGWAAWAEIRETCGDEFLEAVADSVDRGSFKWYESAATAQQELAAGEAAIVGHGQASHSADLRSHGAPLDYVYIENPPLALAHRIAVAARAQHPNAALVYANWLLTRNGQAAACQGLYQSLVYDDLKDCPKAQLDKLVLADTRKGKEQSEELMSLLGYRQ